MDITCENCQSKFKIPDETIPRGKSATLPCPKCKKTISIKALEATNAATDGEVDSVAAEFSFEEDDFETSEKPFDFIEEEGKIALVCESDTVVRDGIVRALELLEYHVSEAKGNRDALRSLRYKAYDLVVVDEYFGTKDPERNGVLIYLERLHMDVRRNMFIALISDRFRTMDHMMAFCKSVNLVINKKNIKDIEKILSRSITDYEMFYRIYKETLV
ncbi:MAG: hypothetical protein DRH90_05575 [Deltaproteobacteria bacterium]|nr:MAG: hypothetical protein DRH90_05575 [Deltaproteobacteria bacterium]RLC18255.1 MAG: hypothetical protein DRI24_03630 [Deltaproteobacteria bacterium]HHE75155.1 hypothetical protein [Desulfobacteraceae bacterium]